MGNDPACMHPEDLYDHDERVCREPAASWESDPPLVCEMPGRDAEQSLELLEALGQHAFGGSGTGAGLKMTALGDQIPQVRDTYHKRLTELEQRVRVMKQQGRSTREIADFVIQERTKIARMMRGVQGPGATVLLEVRDTVKYGRGGRTPENLRRRYGSRFAGDELDQKMIEGAFKSNKGIDQAAKGARYLRHGGRVVLVISVSVTAYRLYTTPREQLDEVIAEEIGAAAGGAIGASSAIGLCIVLGIASGGWGLLACGVVGGIGGGIVGEKIAGHTYREGEQMLFATPADSPEAGLKLQQRLSKDGLIGVDELGKCVAPIGPVE